MTVRQSVPPLPQDVPLVDPNTGKVTLQFQQWWQQLTQNGSTAFDDIDGKVPLTRLINTTTPIAGGGSLAADLTLTHATSGVTAASYTNTNLTVDAKGHITAASNGSSGSTALTLISSTTTASSAADVTFSSIAATYKDLEIRVNGRSDAAGVSNVNLLIQVNSDTGGNYDYAQWGTNGAGGSLANGNAAQTSMIVGIITAATAPANVPGSATIIIHDYARTTFEKGVTNQSMVKVANSSTGQNQQTGAGSWRSTAAINAVKVFPASGNWVDGSTVSLYGRG